MPRPIYLHILNTDHNNMKGAGFWSSSPKSQDLSFQWQETKHWQIVNISKQNRQKIRCGRNKEGTNWCKCDGWVRLSGPGFSNSSPQGSPQTTQTIGKNIETHEKLENTAEVIQNQGTTSDWGWVVQLLAIHHHWSHRRAALNPILSLGLCKCEFKVV